MFGVLWRQMEFIQWNKESAQYAHQQAQIYTVFKIGIQVLHFKIQFAQMFVDKCDQ